MYAYVPAALASHARNGNKSKSEAHLFPVPELRDDLESLRHLARRVSFHDLSHAFVHGLHLGIYAVSSISFARPVEYLADSEDLHMTLHSRSEGSVRF